MSDAASMARRQVIGAPTRKQPHVVGIRQPSQQLVATLHEYGITAVPLTQRRVLDVPLPTPHPTAVALGHASPFPPADDEAEEDAYEDDVAIYEDVSSLLPAVSSSGDGGADKNDVELRRRLERPSQRQIFLYAVWCACFVLVIAVVAVLRHHGWVTQQTVDITAFVAPVAILLGAVVMMMLHLSILLH